MQDSCDTYKWWPGYPMVMSAGGGQMCTCLCPDETAKNMQVRTGTGAQAPIAGIAPGDTILSAGPELDWKPRQVGSLCRLSAVSPAECRMIFAGDRGVTLTMDQQVLTASGDLATAGTLAVGTALRLADGGTTEVTEIRSMPVYAYPLTFVAIDSEDGAPAALLDLNGFVVGDYGTQISALLGLASRNGRT